jgi:hypothetical protein
MDKSSCHGNQLWLSCNRFLLVGFDFAGNVPKSTIYLSLMTRALKTLQITLDNAPLSRKMH